MSFSNLFSPFRLGAVELRNRIVFQPHFTALGTSDGMPSADHIAYHEERARGGVGLIVFESQAVHPLGKMASRFVHAWDPEVVPHYRALTVAVHQHGCAMFGQLTHAGHTSLEHPPGVMWAPTQLPEPSSNFTTKAMDERDITELLDGFAAAARNARDGGFDGVEIKVAHDGVLRSFASPFFNRRTDRYGGSFEKRMRLPLEVLEAIKGAAGDDFPVGVRICLDEDTSFGYDLAYGLRMAERLEASGLVDYFNCDAGSFSSFWTEIPPAEVGTEYFRRLNRELKRRTNLPVVAFGLIVDGSEAEALLAAGEADLIGLCRQLIADPATPRKLELGAVESIRRCIGCNDACTHQTAQDHPVRCVHNPAAGRERCWGEGTLRATDTPRRVTVVGGGPAGLKVAEIAARRGHSVTLLEREHELGGLLRLAARQPHHGQILDVVRYLEGALGRLDVDIRVGVDATPELLLSGNAEAIVLAVGSIPSEPFSEGELDGPNAGLQVVTEALEGLDPAAVASIDDVLLGRVAPREGATALILDSNGHRDAAGTAEFMRAAGWEVVLACSRELVARDLNAISRALMMRRLAGAGVRTATGVTVRSVASGAATLADGLTGEELRIEPLDLVVFAGRRSRMNLFLALDRVGGGPAVERVGDCVVPRLVQSVLYEAEELARAL